MSVSVRMVQVAASTSLGTQNITVPGWGMAGTDIKAAMLIMSRATANNVLTPHAMTCIGLTDGTRQFTEAYVSRDAATPSTWVFSYQNTGELLMGVDAAAGTIDSRAAFSAWIANGIQINWTDAPPSGFLITVIFFAGTSLLAHVNSYLTSASVADVVVVAPAFAVDQVILVTTRRPGFLADLTTGGASIIGFAERGPPIVNHCLALAETHNITPSVLTDYVSTTLISRAGNGAINQQQITVFSGSGFTATMVGTLSAFNYVYLALGYQGAVSHAVQMVDSPTGANGVKSVTTTFKPQFVLQALSSVDVVNVARTASEGLTSTGAGTFGVCGFTANEIFTSYITNDDAASAVAPSDVNTNCLTDNQLNVHADNSSPLFRAAFDSFNALDYRLNYSLLSATVRKWPTLIIGEFVGGGPVTHQGEAVLAVVTGISPTARQNLTGASVLFASGTVASISSLRLAGASLLSGVLSIIPNGSVLLNGQSTLTGLCSVSSTSLLTLGGQVALTSAFTVTTNSSVQLTGASAVSGVFTVSANGLMTRLATATLAATEAVAASARLALAGASTVSSVFTVAAVGVVTRNAAAALSGSFAVSAAPSLALPGAAALSGAFTLSGSPAGSVSGTAGLKGIWTITPNATLAHLAQSALAASFTVSAVSVGTIAGQSALSSSFSVSAAADLVVSGKAELSTTFTAVANGTLAIAGDAVMNSAFTLSAIGSLRLGGASALAATFTMSADSAMTYRATSALASSFAVAANGIVALRGTAVLASAFTVTPVSITAHAAEALLSSVFTVTPAAKASYAAAASISTQWTITASGSLAGDAPGSWNSYGTPRRYLQADNFGISFGLEVYMRAVAGRVNARLYNVTDSAAVSGSEVYVDAGDTTAFVFKKTAALALTNNKVYVSQFALAANSSGETLYAAPVDVNV